MTDGEKEPFIYGPRHLRNPFLLEHARRPAYCHPSPRKALPTVYAPKSLKIANWPSSPGNSLRVPQYLVNSTKKDIWWIPWPVEEDGRWRKNMGFWRVEFWARVASIIGLKKKVFFYLTIFTFKTCRIHSLCYCDHHLCNLRCVTLVSSHFGENEKLRKITHFSFQFFERQVLRFWLCQLGQFSVGLFSRVRSSKWE